MTVILKHTSDQSIIAGHWIWDQPDQDHAAPATLMFRRTFDREALADSPTLRISADSRYRAYLNGQLISHGPCRSTPDYHYYETVDLAAQIQSGVNVLAVMVRWYGSMTPRAQVSLAPGLWAMIGDERNLACLTTDTHWRVWHSEAHQLLALSTATDNPGVYQVVDPCEIIDNQLIPENWTSRDYDDTAWACALELRPAQQRYPVGNTYCVNHELVGREIPPLEEKPIEPQAVMRLETVEIKGDPQIEGPLHPCADPLHAFWGADDKPLVLGGHNTHAITIQMHQLETAFVNLTLQAPAGTVVEFRYAEALWQNNEKIIRDDPAGCVEGYYDLFTCKEGINVFEPFVWRTFRFLRITVYHPNGPVQFQQLNIRQTSYPFEQQATFESSDPLHTPLWDISWHTARCCAHEHYEDCPYYEQLQYVADTRFQALISYMVAGDFRLARQALHQFARSQRPDGIMLSRTPCVSWEPQIIPGFSLDWVRFVEDFWQYSGELNIVEEFWTPIERILQWFDRFDEEGVLKNVPYWLFTDWSFPLDNNVHHAGSEGELNLKRIGTMQSAQRMAQALGKLQQAQKLEAAIEKTKQAICRTFQQPDTGLFCDTDTGQIIGEHASILAILYDVVNPQQARKLVDRLESHDELARTTIYYSYYTFRAYQKLGLWSHVYQTRKNLWLDQLKYHASTWFEMPSPTRSDCHAWGSWIMCDLLTCVLGIQPQKPGFEPVRIEPQTSGIDWAGGCIPTVRGIIRVAWQKQKDQLVCDIDLPEGVTGQLIGPDHQTYPIHPGVQTLTMCP